MQGQFTGHGESLRGLFMTDSTVIRFLEVSKVYPHPAGEVVALDGISLSVEKGEFIAVMGPSGSGKSTLMNLIGCLDTPTSGELIIKGRNVKDPNDDELTFIRRDNIGFIFQQFNLFPLLTVRENIEFPMILKCSTDEACINRPLELVKAVDLPVNTFERRPNELSGGQQQRVAIARALANNPDILLCDEPTGNLDSKTGTGIMELLTKMNKQGTTVIIVTHDLNLARYAERIVEIRDGKII